MIREVEHGRYELIETKGQTKILILNKKRKYAWINAQDIGEILVAAYRSLVQDCVLAIGEYHIYEVKDEQRYRNVQHLELYVGEGVWQGYLLLTGLPFDGKKRNRIVPIREVITGRTTILRQ